jgi:D-alanyl-D-alanine carboxypeptidase
LFRSVLPRRARLRRAVVPLLLAAILFALPAQSTSVDAAIVTSVPLHQLSPQTADALAAALARARRATGVQGLAFAVLRHNGKRGWTGVSGVGSGGSLSIDTPLLIGSVAKTFTAAIILDLNERGRLSIDQRVDRYLPGSRRVVGGATVRQLLNHTSGVRDLYRPLSKRLFSAPNRKLSSRQVLGSVGRPAFKPGTGYAYSNTNYYLLGRIAERVTGKRFHTLVENIITKPYGLSNTALLTPRSSARNGIAKAWTSAFWTSGAMVSTAADLATWARYLYRGGLLGPTMRLQMRTFNPHRYGLGAQYIPLGEVRAYGHSGLLYTNTSLMLYLPKQKITVAIIATSTNVNLNWALTARVNGEKSLLDLARRVGR